MTVTTSTGSSSSSPELLAVLALCDCRALWRVVAVEWLLALAVELRGCLCTCDGVPLPARLRLGLYTGCSRSSCARRWAGNMSNTCVMVGRRAAFFSSMALMTVASCLV